MARAKKTAKKAAPPKAPPAPPPRLHVIEGFSAPNAQAVLHGVYLGREPSFANYPAIHRVRVTAEVIDEPDDVLAARVVDLWETQPYNHHHSDPLQRLAARYGAVLDVARRGCRSAAPFAFYHRRAEAGRVVMPPAAVSSHQYYEPQVVRMPYDRRGRPLRRAEPGDVAIDQKEGICWIWAADEWHSVAWQEAPK